jgi:hypothetical protein
MKFSLPLILGIFVVLLFGLVIAGMVFYKPLMKLWRESGEKLDVVRIRDDFRDGKLDSRFGTDFSGSCSIYEDKGSGLFRVDMGTSRSDAGMVYLKEPLDVSRPITIKHRNRVRNAGGLYQWNAFVLQQRTGNPQCAAYRSYSPGGGGLGVLMRSANALQIAYSNKNSKKSLWWDQEAKVWVPNAPDAPSVRSPVYEFHQAEFHSDGEMWYIVIRDKSGKVIMKSGKVAWSDMKDSGEDYRLFWGDDCTTYFHGDGDSDYIDIRYTPKKTAADKGVKKRK